MHSDSSLGLVVNFSLFNSRFIFSFSHLNSSLVSSTLFVLNFLSSSYCEKERFPCGFDTLCYTTIRLSIGFILLFGHKHTSQRPDEVHFHRKAIALSVCNNPFKPFGHPKGGVRSPEDLQWGYLQIPNYTYNTWIDTIK